MINRHYEHQVIQLLIKLLSVPAPSGREERIAEIVCEEIRSYGYEYEEDPAGNIIVRLPGQQSEAKKMMLAAHMDEIAMVVRKIEANGDLRVSPSGGLLPWKIGEGPLDIVGDNEIINGVFSMGSTHSKTKKEQAINWDNVKVITGLSCEELVACGIRVGSTAVPASSVRGPVIFGRDNDPMVAGWTFDDRIGVISLLRLLEILKQKKITPQRPTLICFTVHEEGGCHGAKVLAHNENPEIFIAVDGCPVQDHDVLKMDGRPGVWSKDSVTHYDQRLILDLSQAAKETGTDVQVVTYDGASSDASHVYSSGHASRVAFFGHVRDNSHGYEVARLSVFDNVINTLVKFIEIFK